MMMYWQHTVLQSVVLNARQTSMAFPQCGDSLQTGLPLLHERVSVPFMAAHVFH
jgi:hypothetical protein